MNTSNTDRLSSSKLKILRNLPLNPQEGVGRFPSWLHRKIPRGGELFKTQTIVDKYQLNTVCEEAKCPNRLHCFSHKIATFLVLGKECLRNCGFCSIDFTRTPKPPAADEPLRVALSVKELGLKHVVITMVARDDLEDGGAGHLAAVIHEIRNKNSGCSIEVLTSDFQGNFQSIDIVLQAAPEIYNHNIETVRRLTPRVRHKATYERTLMVLQHVKKSQKASFVKSGLMVGLGESQEEVFETLGDLKNIGCDIVTIGQYLQPSSNKLSVKDFISPDQFRIYENFGYKIGLRQMYCGPFVRSSFNAGEVAALAQNK